MLRRLDERGRWFLEARGGGFLVHSFVPGHINDRRAVQLPEFGFARMALAQTSAALLVQAFRPFAVCPQMGLAQKGVCVNR